MVGLSVVQVMVMVSGRQEMAVCVCVRVRCGAAKLPAETTKFSGCIEATKHNILVPV